MIMSADKQSSDRTKVPSTKNYIRSGNPRAVLPINNYIRP